MSLIAKLIDLSPLQQAMDAMPMGIPSREPFKTLHADGWVYRDLPRLSKDEFKEFIRTVGRENICWITRVSYGTEKRGQLYMSPEGIKKLAAYLKAQTH